MPRVMVRQVLQSHTPLGEADFLLGVVAKVGEAGVYHIRDETGAIPAVQRSAQPLHLALGSTVKLEGLSLRPRLLSPARGAGVWKDELVCERAALCSVCLVSPQNTLRAAAVAASAVLTPIGSLAPESSPAIFLGVVKTIFPAARVHTRAGRDVDKQTALVVDGTGSIFLTFWGADVGQLASAQECSTVLLVENAVVLSWRGRTVASVGVDTLITLNPPISTTRELLALCEASGALRKSIKVDPADVTAQLSVAAVAKLLQQGSAPTYGKVIGCVTRIPLWGCCSLRTCARCRKRVPFGKECCTICPTGTPIDTIAAIRVSVMGLVTFLPTYTHTHTPTADHRFHRRAERIDLWKGCRGVSWYNCA